jgi:branched-chain amino acid aminotransferase
MKVWLNGELLDAEEAQISPLDRGFLLGDGVFETLRSYNGAVPTLAGHLERLVTGGEVLGIAVPATDVLADGVEAVLAANEMPDARLRITVTAGAPRDAAPSRSGPPAALITAARLQEWSETASAIVAPWVRDERSPLAGVKTTSRAEAVFALELARVAGADEALFSNRSGNLSEATTANVFAVRDGRVETPPLSAGCLAGITRERVLALCAELGVEAREEDIEMAALHDCDELFLTSSTREVQPLVRVGDDPIDDGTPGELTQKLASAFSEWLLRGG